MSWSCFMCVMDVRPSRPPLPFDGRHLALRMEETEEGITCHLLIKLPQSGNKAAAASAAVSALFHFLCGRKLSQHTADRRRAYPASISQVILKWRLTVSHAAPPALSELSEARWRLRRRNTNLQPGDLLQKHWEETQKKTAVTPQSPTIQTWIHNIILLSHNSWNLSFYLFLSSV